MSGFAASGFLITMPAHAECGGDLQCIAVTIDPLVAPAHGTPLTSSPLAFGSQTVATTSAARAIFVGAIGGPPPAPGALATLNAITLGGANAAEFAITGGTCTVGTPSLPHAGAACTITVTFNPATFGVKTASVSVVTTAITRTIPLSGIGGFTAGTARPDPSTDPAVSGLLRSQSATAKRFSRSQISNFQRRMESLHTDASARDAVTPATGFSADRAPVTSVGANVHAGVSVTDLTGNSHPDHSQRLQLANESSGLRRTDAGMPAIPALLLGAVTTRTVNLSSNSDADGNFGLPQGTGLWVGGAFHFGTSDRKSENNSARFSTDGISIGMDHRFSNRLVLGAGMGFARDKTTIGTEGTKISTNGSSIAAYGSYQPSTNTFIDGQLGYGTLGYQTDRYVVAETGFARSQRKGDQLFGSVATGYEHRKEGLLLSPYGRFDFSIDRLKQSTETGAGLSALTYFDQTLRTFSLSLGLRAESQHQTNFGWALPRLRVELKHDFQDDRPATIAYADQFAGSIYSVTPIGVNRNALLTGIGSDFLLPNGIKFGIDYQLQRSFGTDRSQAIRIWLSKELDGKKSLPTLGWASSAKMFADPVVVEAGYAWNDNLNRASNATDKLSDSVYSLNVSKAAIFPVTNHTRLVVTGLLNGEKHYSYHGLDRISGGIQGELQHRTSGAFDAPTFGIFGRTSIEDFDSQLRDGYRASLGVTARQSLTERINAFGALERNVRSAESAVFDTKDYAARFNLDYSLGQSGLLYFGGEYRRGDAVTSAPASSNYLAIAKVSAPDDAYGSRQFEAYRYEARTVSWTLGYNRPLGPRDSLDFSWRRAESTATGPVNLAAYLGTAEPRNIPSYTTNLYSIAYLMRF